MNPPAGDAFLGLLRQFCAADRRRRFSFGSGVAGAVPLRDTELVALARGADDAALRARLAAEAARFLVASLLPLRACGLVLRALLRRLRGGKSASQAARTVVSLGSGTGVADAYFGPFLATETGSCDILRIVGGAATRSPGDPFVESALSAGALARLAVLAVLQPLTVFYEVFEGGRRIADRRVRRLYALLVLLEARSGVLLQNRVIAEALACHLAGGSVRTVLYPMEGRTWEKRLVAQAHAAGARACGYLHCALTPRHAGLLHGGFFERDEIPDVMSAPGAFAAERLAARFPGAEVRARYFVRGERQFPSRRDPGLLLFALTGNVEESGRILRAAATLGRRGGHRIVVRLNPTTSTYARLCAGAREVGLAVYEDGEPAVPGYCFFRSSSVAIDYLRLGVVPVYLDLGDAIGNNSFELDPGHPFERLGVDDGFAEAAAALVARLGTRGIEGGRALADRHLNRDFEPAKLAGLAELV